MTSENQQAIDRAFSKQAEHYDADDRQNPVLQEWRQQVYAHVFKYLLSGNSLLELNAGTGIDAMHFIEQGVTVLATDLSHGMINQLRRKSAENTSAVPLIVEQCSYEDLDQIRQKDFDYIFSNFGGLNCQDNLSKIAVQIPRLLKPGGYVTWVIMPPISLWECAWVFKGNFTKAFRRFDRNGTMAHLDGEYFKTYYHSLSSIRKALGNQFSLIRSEGLGCISPPPASTNFYRQKPGWYRFLRKIDRFLKDRFPFNHSGDHIIVTFKLNK
jgi:ubiquinone/menaquinone biosynthesis C-methylase UbiE